ncbi:hypothetical protein D3C87_1600400 [compost metagenome]
MEAGDYEDRRCKDDQSDRRGSIKQHRDAGYQEARDQERVHEASRVQRFSEMTRGGDRFRRLLAAEFHDHHDGRIDEEEPEEDPKRCPAVVEQLHLGKLDLILTIHNANSSPELWRLAPQLNRDQKPIWPLAKS